ncbi:MAG: hypothetical protein HOV82_11850 [Streptomyces sp.]|nr:hypothetical protein [Streptomyces sp.]NUS28303.1 hypothetical protein [Streptomyces sp.]
MNSGWHGNGYSSGSDEHEPSEDSGQAAWGAQGHDGGGALPPWASAETQTSYTPPWTTPPPQPHGPPPQPYVPPPQPYVPPPQPYVPPPPPPPSGGPRRLLVVLTVMAVLGSGVGAGVWFLTRDGSVGADATPAPSVVVTSSASTPTTPEATPSVTTFESPPASPGPAAGYRLAEDPVGYTIVVPEGWTRRQKQGEKAAVVFYDAPDDGRQLQIFRLAEDSPGESLRQAENDPGFGFARQPGYQALERDEGTTWSELTYRYDDEDKGARQVIDHRFEAADGTLYAIRASGPEDLSPAQVREPLSMALSSFCPAGQECA